MAIKDNNFENPGKIYSSISVDSRDFSSGVDKLTTRKLHPYVKFCKKIYSKFPGLGKNTKYSSKLEKAISFLNWDLSAEEYNATIKFTLIFGVFLAIILIAIAMSYLLAPLAELFGNIMMGYFICIAIPVTIFLIIFKNVQNFPFSKVDDEKIKALTFVPEIMGYLIMSMKLVPNLEKAIEFASNRGHGKISEDLKKLLWEVKVGIKNSVAQAIDELAYKWGDVSIELKKGLMKIRASVIESSEAKRYQLLDQTMADTLSSIKDKLEDYARTLSQPTMAMFYLGVLLPLLLIIILPVGSAFSGSALAKSVYLVLIYNIALPIGCYVYAKSVIKKRPATYIPPKIPDSHPDLPPKNTFKIGSKYLNVFFILIVLLVGGIGGSIYLQNQFGVTKGKILLESGYDPENPEFESKDQENEFWSQPENDVTPYYVINGILITICLAISLWCYVVSIYKRKIQLKTEKMEDEFKDALYIIASRLGENKPIEDALEHTRSFLPNSLIAQSIFGKTIDNIKILGLNLHSALFDKSYGALKNNPSNIINSAMQLLSDSVQLGVNVAAKTLMSYSMQLRNTDDVNKTLTNLITSVTSTLSSMSKFITPIVLGITTSLQKVVTSTLYSIANSGTLKDMEASLESIKDVGGSMGANINTSSMTSMGSINTEVVSQLATTTEFTIIVAIYVVQIVIIMTYFTTMIEQDNMTLVKLRIAQTLPVAITLFIITVMLSSMIF